jgi:hypothetical protein
MMTTIGVVNGTVVDEAGRTKKTHKDTGQPFVGSHERLNTRT